MSPKTTKLQKISRSEGGEARLGKSNAESIHRQDAGWEVMRHEQSRYQNSSRPKVTACHWPGDSFGNKAPTSP